jgi:hypothetical protein
LAGEFSSDNGKSVAGYPEKFAGPPVNRGEKILKDKGPMVSK